VAELKVSCDCRKPAPGMLRRAARELPIDLTRSVVIGDSWRDMGAARALDLPAYGVRTGAACRELPGRHRLDLLFTNVVEAVDFALSYRTLAAPVLSALGRDRASESRPLVVAVCGRACAGKSALAHACERAIREDGGGVLRVSLDDWIVPLAERSPGMDPPSRNRVGAYRGIVEMLAGGGEVEAPGYDANTRGVGQPVLYAAPAAETLILDGVFAGHESLRDLTDLVVYVDCEDGVLRERFREFYRWKGKSEGDIDLLLEQRSMEEWNLVDAQRPTADLVVSSGGATGSARPAGDRMSQS
jgi:uridine kinase